MSLLKETRVCTLLAIYNTCICLKYTTFFSETYIFLLHMQLMSLQPAYSSQKCKKYVFQNSGSLGSYAIDSFSCNYFVFNPNSS